MDEKNQIKIKLKRQSREIIYFLDTPDRISEQA